VPEHPLVAHPFFTFDATMNCGQQDLEVPIEQIVPTSEGTVEIVHETILKQEAEIEIEQEEMYEEVVEEEGPSTEVKDEVEIEEGAAVIVESHPEQDVMGTHQVFVEQNYGVGEYVIPDDTLTVQEEVVISENCYHIDDVASNETVVYSANGDEEVVQLREEEIIGTPSSETEMSVAMDLAKLSQGHFENTYNTARVGDAIASMPKITPHPPCGAEKPRLSYAQMIAESLMQAEDRMLPLCEIYIYITQKYPYFRMDVKSWQNAIRHNLTLNPSFQKVPRPNNEGRGNFWRMEDGAERQIFKRTIRSHHYKMARFDPNKEQKQQQQQQQQQQQNHQQHRVVLISPQDEVKAATTSIVETTVPVATATEEIRTTGRTLVVANGGGGRGIATSGPSSNNIQTVTLNRNFLQQNAVQMVGGQQIVFISLPPGARVSS
jgi:hypothetical protein